MRRKVVDARNNLEPRTNRATSVTIIYSIDNVMESTCGALIGAVMVAGILTDGKGTPRISKELVQNFERKCGATICKDLKGIGTGKVLCPCPECVRNAVLSLGEVLEE